MSAFMTTPSITAMSFLNVQYVLMSCCNWFLLSGHPCMTYSMRCRRCWSWDATSCNSCIVMHSSMVVVDCITLILTYMPVISSSLSLLWLCMDSQSVINRSGLGLYMILPLYWCFLSKIHCSLCENLVTTFMKMAMCGLWSVIILTSLTKQ